MSLHLLGTKSWHVWNEDNLLRVKEDEAAAKIIEDDRQKKIISAEAEVRLSVLRERATVALPEEAVRTSSRGGAVASASSPIPAHINLFDGSEIFAEGGRSGAISTKAGGGSAVLHGRAVAPHPEFEKERVAAEERARQAAGYKDWKFADVVKQAPWYSKVPSASVQASPLEEGGTVAPLHSSAARSAGYGGSHLAGAAYKSVHDPLEDMRKYVAATRICQGLPPSERGAGPLSATASPPASAAPTGSNSIPSCSKLASSSSDVVVPSRHHVSAHNSGEDASRGCRRQHSRERTHQHHHHSSRDASRHRSSSSPSSSTSTSLSPKHSSSRASSRRSRRHSRHTSSPSPSPFRTRRDGKRGGISRSRSPSQGNRGHAGRHGQDTDRRAHKCKRSD